MNARPGRTFVAALGVAPLLVLLATATPAFAADHGEPGPDATAENHGGAEHHGIDAKTLIAQVFNLAALLFVVIKFAGPAVNKSLQARHDQLKADLEDANRMRTEAEQRAAAQEKRLANLELELTAMRVGVRRDTEDEEARLVAAAEERAKRIGDDTRFQMEQQVKDAQLRFQAEVANASVKIAEALLRRSVEASDEQRLAKIFVIELGAAPPTDTAKGTHGSSPQEKGQG